MKRKVFAATLKSYDFQIVEALAQNPAACAPRAPVIQTRSIRTLQSVALLRAVSTQITGCVECSVEVR